MSGAQPKAADIAGATSIVAEVDESRIHIRYEQGWVNHIAHSLEEAVEMARKGIAVSYTHLATGRGRDHNLRAIKP